MLSLFRYLSSEVFAFSFRSQKDKLTFKEEEGVQI